ncbi:hypothetical protein [Aequorivita echinoideorum]|uniref:Lipoprotein n=1 Tax=Aequorivita echinoideorum TaxID=1549647 RepID=A0ABS5S227_9FLAO|nr:hypothetical protein [Aequorivita echinoideorum]MBT0607246.1 hypothetical protein [Aequorivita echinoideorum]
MKYILILSILVLASCSSGQKKMAETIKFPLELSLKQTVTMDGTSITFNEVTEDSRCPTNVQCVWAGRAKVSVTIAESGKAPVEKKIILGETREGENDTKMVLKTGEYILQASELKPYPKDSNNEISGYVLEITKEDASEN